MFLDFLFYLNLEPETVQSSYNGGWLQQYMCLPHVIAGVIFTLPQQLGTVSIFAATPTWLQGNAWACNNKSDAESLQCQCDAYQELHMNQKKGSPIDTQWDADEVADQVTPPNTPTK